MKAYTAPILAAVRARALTVLDAVASEEAYYSLPVEERDPAVLAAVRRVLPVGQDLQPCICGGPRWSHSGTTRSGRCSGTVDCVRADPCDCRRYCPDDVEAYAQAVVAADAAGLVRDFDRWDRANMDADPKVDGQISVRPSDAGGCGRTVWYRNFPPPDYTPARDDKRAAVMGTVIHKGFLDAQAALYPWRWVERWVKIPGLDRRGRVDMYDPVTGVLTDLKTAGDTKWDSLAADGPSDSMWDQSFVYGLALTRAGEVVRTVRIVVVHRGKGVEEVHERPFTVEAGKAALRGLTALASQLDAYRAAVDVDPDRARDLIPLRAGTTHTSFPCSWDGGRAGCPARDHCWGVTAAAAARRSPTSWTLLGPDPQTEAVEMVLAEYHEGLQLEKAGLKRKADSKATLDGLEYGTYGAFVYEIRTKQVNDGAGYVRALQAAYQMPADRRPPLEDIVVKKLDQEYIHVAPVRAAKVAKKAAVARRAKAENTPPPVEGAA